MLRWLFRLISLLVLTSRVLAQTAETDLIFSDIHIRAQVDVFGTTRQIAVGMLTNQGTHAYADVILSGDVLDKAGRVVGEAYGGLVNRCGTAFSNPIQPGQTRNFSAPVDVSEEGTPQDVQLTVQAAAVDPELSTALSSEAITPITSEEVAAVEWEGATTLRYGVGCPTDVFTRYEWYRHVSGEHRSAPITHPAAAIVTPEFIAATGITDITQSKGKETDPTLFDRSMLTFTPDGTRALVQTDLHDLYSIERDGAFRRRVQTGLYQHTLQGYVFTPQGMFLAYYYGTYGDPVRYITASVRGGAISLGINEVTPSVTVPGVTDDGQRAIISGTFPIDGKDVTGYFWQRVGSSGRELLFETDQLPGNNYPAPLFWRVDSNTRFIYIIRPINAIPTLQCLHYESKTLTTLTPVPLNLASSERAGVWLSPDGKTLALAATGAHGGLWQIDLTLLPSCEVSAL